MSFPFRFVALAVMAAALQAAPPPLRYTAILGTADIAAIAVDASGSVYVAGTAFGALPATPGAFETAYQPATCFDELGNRSAPCSVAFAAKLTPDGTGLVYLTYLGSSNSGALGISIDAQGDAWITGFIGSTDLPVTPGALQSKPGSAYVVKLNPSGSTLLYASYLGGSGGSNKTSAQGLDAAGNLFIAGYTFATDFLTTSGAFQTIPNAGPAANVFVMKLDPTGKLIYSTYFHGSQGGSNWIAALAVDALGNTYFTGGNKAGSLPVTPGAFQTNPVGGVNSAYAAKLDPTGTTQVYCTFLTGASPSSGIAIAVDAQGNAYIGGQLTVQAGVPASFPVTPGAFQTTPPPTPPESEISYSFLAKLNPSASALVYSTYLYGSSDTEIAALAVDASGAVVAVGDATAFDFPTTPGALYQCDPNQAPAGSGFLLRLAPDGSHPLYSTYLGADGMVAVQLDASGEAYLAGGLNALLPLVPGSFGWNGSGAFVASLSLSPLAPGSVSCVSSAASHGGTAIAPGEIVDIWGNGIGPAQAVSASAASGQLPMSLGGVQVLFEGFAAPLLFAGPNQIRAIVPFETYPDPDERGAIQVLNPSVAVEPLAATVASQAPSIFTLTGASEGQALVINQDGTLNSPQNPAPPGSIATLYATGLNNTAPPLADGSIASAAAPLALAPGLLVNSAPAEITYSGAAPGFEAGLTQINFLVPTPGPDAVDYLSFAVPEVPGVSVRPPTVYFYWKQAPFSPQTRPARSRPSRAASE